MPVGYRGEGKTFSKKMGKWVTKEKEKAIDYESLDEEQKKVWALILSFFTWFPDYFYDLIESENAKYRLELIQRVILRIFARYRNTYCTGARGLTKTYILMMSKNHDGQFFPGEKIRYVAPAQKQSAKLASDAFKTMGENYPLMAKWWNVNSDRSDMFRITTIYNSEFTMYAPRGDNCSSIVGEEIAQEGESGFNIEVFESDISPTCRLTRKIHGIDDRIHINLKETYISNASSRQNKAFTVYRKNALNDMLYGDDYDGYCIDISWIAPLLCNIRDIAYYKKEKRKLTHENWLKEMCVRYTGNGENPLITDEDLSRSRKLTIMETEHCQNPDCIYIVAHDVSYVDNRKNAKCSDAVLKLTRYDNVHKRDRYKAQAVFVDNYPPPKTDYLQAQKLKQLWLKYCMDGANTTYLVIDAQTYGTAVIEELMKPTTDGTLPLCCVGHQRFKEIEQKNALPVIVPIKAAGKGATYADGDLIRYAQTQFEQGNIELLTGSILDGVDEYKKLHNLKDNFSDGKIAMPYKNTDLLCQQISNLKTEVGGTSLKEKRKSKSIQRDIWSALKYALWQKHLLEEELKIDEYKPKSSWSEIIKSYENGQGINFNQNARSQDDRSRLIGMRRI